MSLFKETVITASHEWNTLPNWATGSSFIIISIFAFCVFEGYDSWLLPLAIAYYASDYLDGHWARKYDEHTALGKILDPARDHYCDLLLSFVIAWAASSVLAWEIAAGIWLVEITIISINFREWGKESTCGGIVHTAGKVARQTAYVIGMVLFSLNQHLWHHSFLSSQSVILNEAILAIMYFASACALLVYGKARGKF